MKTIKIIIAAGFMSISSISIAQEEDIEDFREEVSFGLKAGLNFSNVYNSQTEDFRADGKIGFAGGAVLTIPISKFIGIQPEFLISQKGFEGTGQFLGSDYTFTRTTTYIDVPLQVSFKPSKFVRVLAGPQYSYLIRQKDDFNNAFIDATHEENFDNENIRKNIFGFVTGLDITLEHFVIGTRVGWDISANHGDGSSSTPKYKNVWLQATIGYTFYQL